MVESAPGVAVVGAGPSGLAAALAMAQRGLEVTLLDKEPIGGLAAAGGADRRIDRTAALMRPTIAFLDSLGVWDDVKERTTPLAGLRIIRLGRSVDGPPLKDVVFRAHEIGEETFGANTVIADLRTVLAEHVLAHERITDRTGLAVADAAFETDAACLELEDGTSVPAALVIAADGRSSPVRRMAGIAANVHDYKQSAITCVFEHGRPHRHVSIELHKAGGPLTTVPMPQRSSSLVWVERTKRAEGLSALSDERFTDELERFVGGYLGRIKAVRSRSLYPLQRVLARRLSHRRLLLIGEAAHAMSPIGAQGLNLSLGDVAAAARLIGDALRDGRDPGDALILRAYGRERWRALLPRFAGVDGLNRLVASDSELSVQSGRFGLDVMASIPPLRRAVMSNLMGRAS